MWKGWKAARVASLGKGGPEGRRFGRPASDAVILDRDHGPCAHRASPLAPPGGGPTRNLGCTSMRSTGGCSRPVGYAVNRTHRERWRRWLGPDRAVLADHRMCERNQVRRGTPEDEQLDPPGRALALNSS
jgi:hypothetical protein